MFTLTPQARAIAAFALAFTLVTGSLNRIGIALIAVFDSNLGGTDHAVAVGVVTFVVGIGVLWLAGQAAAATAGETWALGLAQAARVLAAVGLLVAALTLLSTLVQDGPSTYFPYLAG
jgi:hypothetical protein